MEGVDSIIHIFGPNVAVIIIGAIISWRISRHNTEIRLLLSKLTDGQVEIKKDLTGVETRVSPLEIDIARLKGKLNMNGYNHA